MQVRRAWWISLLAGCSNGSPGDGGSSELAPQLTWIATHELPLGTHRPELLVTDEGFIVVAVSPSGTPGVGQVKHRAFVFDRSWNQRGDAFPVTRFTAEYGDPSDHRAVLIDDALVVVYQSLVWQGGLPPVHPQGPMEQYATEQSLVLARFSLDGTELERTPIVPHATDFAADNFPDHCLAAARDGSLRVSTGSTAATMKIREVELDGTITSTATVGVPSDSVGSTIGNSLQLAERGLVVFSATDPNRDPALLVASLDAEYRPTAMARFASDSLEQNFPVGNAVTGAYTVLTHIGRTPGALDLDANPYDAYVKILDNDHGFAELSSQRVGVGGFSHVHPTVAVVDDRAYVAWSHRVDRNGAVMPQILIEEFEIAR